MKLQIYFLLHPGKPLRDGDVGYSVWQTPLLYLEMWSIFL